MSGPHELAADQAAVISLLVRQRRSYGAVARLLGVDEQAVIGRARAALDALAPRETTPPPAAERQLLADYLLGQLASTQAESARGVLLENRAARVWARAITARLGELAPGATPEIPVVRGPSAPVPYPGPHTLERVPHREAPQPTPERAPAASAPLPASTFAAGPASGERPSSRVGGAILLLALGALLVAAILLVTRIGGGGGQGVVTGGSAAIPAAGPTGASPFQVLAHSVLNVGPAGGVAQGAVELVSEGAQRGIVVAGRHLAPTAGLAHSGFDYTLWLTGTGGMQELGVAPPVGRDGALQALGALPTRTGGFQTVLVTRETTRKPTAPGPVVLSGTLPAA